MGYLAPSMLAFTAILPGIVALYFLKLHRRDREVSSTWLWQSRLLDRQANSLWQRLRITPLLLIQLLAALALILATAHPFTWAAAATARNTVVLLDGSGAMLAADVRPNRFAEAKRRAEALIDQLPAGGQMSLILLTRAPQILAANSTDRTVLRQALDAATATAGEGDLGQGLAIATSLLRGQPEAQIVVIGNGRYRGADGLAPSPVPVAYIPVGNSAPNVAVTALATRRVAEAVTAFAQVANFGSQQVATTAEFWADEKLITVDRATIPTGESHAFTWTVPPGARTLEVRLPAPDTLELDNRAWALTGGGQRSRVLLVTAGNPFLVRALQLIPGAEVTTVAPVEYRPGEYDLYVFDRFMPPIPPEGRTLLVAPPGGAADRFVGKITAKQGDPILRFVDVSEVHVNMSPVYAPAANARILWEGETDAGRIPLLWTEGNDRALFAFALGQSDLPLRTAFPILMQNLSAWLLPPAPVDSPSVQTAESVALRPWPGATRLTVKPPAGTAKVWDLNPGSTPPFLEVNQPGIYTVTQVVGGGQKEARFAVNLFSANVSNLEPATELTVPVLPDAQPPPTKAPLDIWRWVGWAALAAIAVEWWVYRRGY